MIELNKKNLEAFLKYYHNFHDSYIQTINYDVQKQHIEIMIDVVWSGEPTLREDKTYETNRTKVRMVFEKVEAASIIEINSWDFIYTAYIKYVKFKGKELICFATDEEDPFVYIVCDNIKYEELGK